MKKSVLLFLFFLNTAIYSMAQSSEESLIKRCATHVNIAISMALNNMPVQDVSEYVDSLYDNLVIKPANTKVAVKYIGMIPLQAYLLMSNDSRADYEQIEECLIVCGKFEPFLDKPFLVCAICLGEYFEKSQPSKAIGAYLLAEKANKNLYNGELSPFSQIIDLHLSHLYFEGKQWAKAIPYQERLVNYHAEDTEDYFNNINTLGFLNKMSGRYQVADSCYLVCQLFLEKYAATDENDYTDILINRAEIKIDECKYKEAESILLAAETKSINNIPIITEVWKELAILYNETGDTQKEFNVFRKALSYYEKYLEPENIQVLSDWIVECDNPNSDNERARLIKILEKQLPTDDIFTLSLLTRVYQKSGLYEKASSTCKKVESLLGNMSQDRKDEYTNDLIQMYFSLNLYSKVIELANKEVESVMRVVGEKHPLYTATLSMLGEYYFFNGDYYKALETFNECLSSENIDEGLLFDTYDNVATVYSFIGEYDLSNKYLDYIITHTQNKKKLEKSLNLYVGNIVSELDIIRNDINESVKVSTDTLKHLALSRAKKLNELCVAIYGQTHIRTIESLQLLASAYNLVGDNDNMIKIAEKTDWIIRKYVTNNDLKKNYLESLVSFYIYSREFKKARNLVDASILKDCNSLSVTKDFTLFALSEINLMEGKYKEAQRFYTDLTNLRIGQLNQQMSMLKSQSRQQYWRKYRQEMMNAAKYADKFGVQDEFSDVIYNLSLYSKRLLLGSDNTFRSVILESGDSELKEKFDLLNVLRVKLNQNRISKTSDEYLDNQILADRLEKELLMSVDLSRYDQGNIQWQDVQKMLDLDAIAIELIEYKDKTECDQYGAVMIRRNWVHPIAIQLGEKHSIDKLLSENGLLPDNQNIWKEIHPFLGGISTIYFSPVGVFHQVPIEYLNDVEGYSVFRLSSTAELCKKHDEKKNGAVIYGGLVYKEGKYQTVSEEIQNRGTVTLPYLIGTLAEAKAIDSVLKQSHETVLKIGTDGTEQSFKDLSGKQISLMHIATHGTFIESNKSNNRLLKLVLSQGVGEDHALTRSCLFMSGALNALHATDDNDGILTALEVSSLDFRGLDLITLSACETAKGDITGDGVFGLQRGFKKAGANTILMSLRKVDDKATQVLMSDFYEQLANGVSKYEALNHARNKVRQTPQWESPEFWAPFILLDALPR